MSLLGLVALFLALSVQSIWSPDIWWQLRTGQWIAQNRVVPMQDFLSYTRAGHEWVVPTWLFCLAAYCGWRIGGPPLLILAQSAVLAVTLLIIVWRSRRLMAGWMGLSLVALAICATSVRYSVRPELITYLSLSLFLTLLEPRDDGRPSRWIWILPLVQVIWVNSHGLFILGPIVAWTLLVGRVADRWPLGARSGNSGQAGSSECPAIHASELGVAILVLPACFLNPWGRRMLTFTLELFRELHGGSVAGQAIMELLSPLKLEPWTWEFHAAGILFALTSLTFVPLGRRLKVGRLLVWIQMTYLASVAMRNIGLLGFTGLWVALRNLDDARRLHCRQVAGASAWTHGLITSISLLTAWYVATDRYYARWNVPRECGLGIVRQNAAIGVARFLAEARPQGQLFHSMSDGSYFTWAAPAYKVMLDGRLEVYGEDYLRQALYVDNVRRSWNDIIRDWSVQTVVLDCQQLHQLAPLLVKAPEWVPVYLDERDIIFVRDMPDHADLIRRFRIDPGQLWTPLDADRDERPPPWKRAIGAVAYPWYSLGLAKNLMRLGAFDSAQQFLRRELVRFPQDRSIRILLTQLCRAEGRDPEADQLLAGLTLSPDETALAAKILYDIMKNQGREARAVPHLQAAVCAKPDDIDLRSELAQAYRASGNHSQSAAAYRAAAQLAPNEPARWARAAYAAEEAGELENSVESFRRALPSPAAQPDWSERCAALLIRLGRADEARAVLEEALSRSPDNPDLLEAIGRFRPAPKSSQPTLSPASGP